MNQKQGIPEACEISQPKQTPYEKGLPLRNNLQPKGTRCKIKGLLRNGPPSTKPFRSPIAPLCETPPWHTSAISQPKASFRSCETLYETIQGPQKLNFAAKASFRSCENPYETPIWHTSAISQPHPLIWQLRKWPLAAKMGLCCEMTPPVRKIPIVTWLLI